MGNRYEEELAGENVVAFNSSSLVRLWRNHQRDQRADEYAFHEQYGSWFAKSVLRCIKKRHNGRLNFNYFGFTTGALETIEYLRQNGVFCVVQQIDPAHIHHRLVAEEARLWPGWQRRIAEIPASYLRRLENEWRLSSKVVVNSEWSRQALIKEGVPSEKLVIIPLAYERPRQMSPPARSYRGRPLRVLWLGSVVLAKGIAYMVEAARLLRRRKIEFLVAGPIGIDLQAINDMPENVRFFGRIHRDQVAQVVAQADVYVLPTISDGFALTQLEAMAQGLPVITTPNCGEVVTPGRDGLIVPARDSSALADAIAQFDDNREMLGQMASEALNTVARFSIRNYGQRLVATAEVRNSYANV